MIKLNYAMISNMCIYNELNVVALKYGQLSKLCGVKNISTIVPHMK